MNTPAAPRLISPESRLGDAPDAALRPQQLSDFIGQPELSANLKVFIEAAKKRGESLDHVLLYGPRA